MFYFKGFTRMGLSPNLHRLTDTLYWHFQRYKVPAVQQKRFSYQDFRETLFSLTNNELFRVTELGLSAEGRELYLVKTGHGPIKLFLWSQMHGDEPTATQAIFDILYFLSCDDDLNFLREEILRELTIYILPRVNPDGAERFTRENAAGVDLNRDALALATPEAEILLSTFKKIQPDYGFNLHDQDPRYSLGEHNRQAALSFLAPPFNEARELNPNRERAMQVIAGMNEALQCLVPGHIGRYSDEYEPRAFGDTFQSLGAATILIESGAWRDDPEKQIVRQLNVIALLSAFILIAENQVSSYPIALYNDIPFNERNLYDLVLRNARFQRRGKWFTADIAINLYDEPLPGGKKLCTRSQIEEIGGITGRSGLQEIECAGIEIVPPRCHHKSLRTLKEIQGLNCRQLVQKGISLLPYATDLILPDDFVPALSLVPEEKGFPTDFLKTGQSAEFILQKDNSPVAIIRNGFYVRVSPDAELRGNGIVIR